MVNAEVCYYKKIKFHNGSVAFGIIWKLPVATQERHHGYKYRLNYCAADGTTIARYDNETGKGDHKHVYDKEVFYLFKNIDTLIADFWRDVEREHEKQEYK